MASITRGQRTLHLGSDARRNPSWYRNHAAEIEASADQIAAVWNILPMNAATFRAWAKLMHRRSDGLIEDAMIAATAQVHGLQVVTRNVRHFKAFGIAAFNPYPLR